MDTIGVIGIGSVGSYFVEWLAEEHDVVATDVDEAARDRAREAGATVRDHPAAVTESADIVVLSLPGREYVEAVMEGAEGVLEVLSAGQVVIDTGTTPPDTEARYERVCASRDAFYLDAPLTWGGPGDYDEDAGPAFTMFVGGSEEAYGRARPVVETLSHSHRRFGDVGSGQVAKAGHRLRQNARAAVDAEMVEFYRNNGIDPEAVDDLMAWGLRERFFEDTYPSVAGWERATEDGDVARADERGVRLTEMGARPRLRESHWAKDQAYAMAIAYASNTSMPISSEVYQLLLESENYAAALLDRELSFGDADWSDRDDVIAPLRRRNRPAEEWRRLRWNVDRD